MPTLAEQTMQKLRYAAALGAVITALVSCSRQRGGESPKGDAAAKDSAGSVMADMPGMAMPSTEGDKSKSGALATTLELSAAQIAHGRVEWAAVTMGNAAATAAAPAQLVPDEDHTSRLGAPVRGRVLSVLVSPGDRVARRQALAVLQSADATMAQSDVAKSLAAVSSRRAQAQYAGAAKDRAERLLALKAIARQEYEKAVADDELAQAELRQAEAEFQRARNFAEQIGADSSANGNITLRAPAAGVVLTRMVSPGAVVDAGVPMLTVTDPARLWLTANAPEQFAGMLRRGERLRFVVPAYPDTFAARITALGPGLDSETRTLAVRANADSRGNRLKPGMLATVIIAGGQQQSVALVPEDAVQAIDGKSTVFLVRPDGKGGAQVTRREVEVGSRSGGRVSVIRGLIAGDVIVVSGAFAVKAEFQKGGMGKMVM
jgi:membrane fusion protein, heavy metal efflux system